MIVLTLEQAIAAYCGVWVLLFLGCWAVTRTVNRRSGPPVRIWQCSICMYVFSTQGQQHMTECPRCGCYITQEGGQSGDH